MPRILPLHPRRNGAFLFRSRDIRLEREQIPADLDFSRVNRVPRKYISPKEIEFFKIYYYTCVKLTIFLTFWIFKMIEEKSLFHTMSRYRKIFKGDAARDSPRLFQHPPTLACVVRSSLEIRQKIITPILKADKFSIVYFVSRAKFFSIKNIDACNYIITYIWQNSIINTFKKKKDRQ